MFFKVVFSFGNGYKSVYNKVAIDEVTLLTKKLFSDESITVTVWEG